LQINFIGHYAAAVCGLGAAFLLFVNFGNPLWSRRLRSTLIVLVVLLVSSVVYINLWFPSIYLPTEWNTDYMQSRFQYMIKREPLNVGLFFYHDSEMYNVCSKVDVLLLTVLKHAKKINSLHNQNFVRTDL